MRRWHQQFASYVEFTQGLPPTYNFHVSQYFENNLKSRDTQRNLKTIFIWVFNIFSSLYKHKWVHITIFLVFCNSIDSQKIWPGILRTLNSEPNRYPNCHLDLKSRANNDKVPRFKRVQTCLTAYEVFSWYIRQISSKYMQVYDFICTLKRLPDYPYLFTPEEHVQKRSFPLTGVCMVRLDLFRRFPPPTCAKDGSAAKLYKTKSSRLLAFQARGGLKWL